MIDMEKLYKAQKGDQKNKIYIAEQVIDFGKKYIRKYYLHNEYEDNLQEVYLSILNAINNYNGIKSITLPPALLEFLKNCNSEHIIIYFESNINAFLIDTIKSLLQNTYVHLYTPTPKGYKGALYIDDNDIISYTKDLEFKEVFGEYKQTSFTTYAGTVIKNTLKNQLKKKNKIPPQKKIKDVDIYENNDIIQDLKQDIESIKDSLPEIESVIIEKIMKGVVQKDIAKFLNLSKSQFNTAFDKLREKIKKIYLKGA